MYFINVRQHSFCQDNTYMNEKITMFSVSRFSYWAYVGMPTEKGEQIFSNSFVISTLLDRFWKCFSNPLEDCYFSADDWLIFRPRVLRFTNSKTCHDLISYPGGLSFPKTLSVRSELLYFLANTYENAVKITGMFVCFAHELRPL